MPQTDHPESTATLAPPTGADASDVNGPQRVDGVGGGHSVDSDVALVLELREKANRLRAEIKKRIVGQDDVVELLLLSLFARGHGLFVGVPGLAKTLLIQTLASGLGLSFNRIQFTPDLMPSDITGTDVLEEDKVSGARSFRFIKGPVFANVLLADEINRTPPKTQAALLQAMQEQKVSAGGNTYDLDQPFLVFATQNPIEQEGTYPLPEAQLDRFMFLIEVDYPSEDDEMEIVRQTTGGRGESPMAVLSANDVLRFQELVRRVPVPDGVVRFAVQLTRATRPDGGGNAGGAASSRLSWGAGPRASQSLVLAAKARAALQGRFAASDDDVKAVAVAVLAHRVVVTFQAQAQGVRAADVIKDIVASVAGVKR
jgi:MoxR-like ATPase